MSSCEKQLDNTACRAIIESAPNAVFVVDADTDRIVGTNEAGADLLDRSRSDIIGLSPSDLHPSGGSAVPDRSNREGRAASAADDIGYVVTAEGERVPVECSTSSMEIDGRALLIRHVRDVSERVERQRELRGFKTAVEQAGHAILLTDVEGRIEYVNPAFEAFTGYDKSEVIGKTPSILQSGRHDEQFYADLWETITSGERWEGDLVNTRKDGEQYHIHQTIAPITDENGEIERFVGINVDISDRKRYERQLEREREQLDLFASTIAHDLRNPLGIALGHVDIARQSAGDESLDKAIDALERMDAMITEILSLSKHGETVRDPESIQFQEAVERAWERVDTADATLSVVDSTESCTISADPMRFEELLTNLFRNAIEHCEDETAVTVGQLPDGHGFYVADDGPGIDVEPPNRVFNTGFTTSAGGTGFGLTIVEQIADAHGWAVSITDAADGGARFEFITDTSKMEDDVWERRSGGDRPRRLNWHWD